MPLVALTADEVPAMRQAMLDVQTAVADYYAATARTKDTGVPVRGFLSAAQVVNDLLTNTVSDAAAYSALFTQPSTPGTEIVQGVKYARNVVQHVLSLVRPNGDHAIVGGPEIGYRIYEKWDEVSAAAHADLRPTTQTLKAAYDSALFDEPVVWPMLDLLRFYQTVNPAMVHRDDSGEWSGFPLMDQPGVPDRLHPEEPRESSAAWAWLDSRVPNGTARVVCAQVLFEDTRYLCGFTFTGRHSFSPFAETVDQVERDLVAGTVYLEGDLWANVDNVRDRIPRAQGPVFFSRSPLDAWASPMTALTREQDWALGDDTATWAHVAWGEWAAGWPQGARYIVRRARRLNACVPPSS